MRCQCQRLVCVYNCLIPRYTNPNCTSCCCPALSSFAFSLSVVGVVNKWRDTSAKKPLRCHSSGNRAEKRLPGDNQVEMFHQNRTRRSSMIYRRQQHQTIPSHTRRLTHTPTHTHTTHSTDGHPPSCSAVGTSPASPRQSGQFLLAVFGHQLAEVSRCCGCCRCWATPFQDSGAVISRLLSGSPRLRTS